MTLEEAQKQFIKDVAEGTKCPCCGRYAKIYKRLITASMVNSLRWIDGEKEKYIDRWVPVQQNGPTEVVKTNCHPTLVYWGLIEKKDSGVYRATLNGQRFLNNEYRVQKYALIYNNTVIGFDGSFIEASDCVGVFDYEALLEKTV